MTLLNILVGVLDHIGMFYAYWLVSGWNFGFVLQFLVSIELSVNHVVHQTEFSMKANCCELKTHLSIIIQYQLRLMDDLFDVPLSSNNSLGKDDNNLL